MAVRLEPFFMPLATSSLAPHFHGDPHQLPAYLDEVDQLCNKAGLTEKARIKTAIQYADPMDADIWRHTPESNGNDFEKFANTILRYYPGCTLGHFKCAIPEDLATSDASGLLLKPTQDTSNPMLPDQSLNFENPLITDDTDFCNSSETVIYQ
ncbi:hypothetical protein BDR03DRAFT_1016037 [Suillus americanus]|nr:hypothetical protein BDR03DRAFT_1016037 [Suillus americanus]